MWINHNPLSLEIMNSLNLYAKDNSLKFTEEQPYYSFSDLKALKQGKANDKREEASNTAPSFVMIESQCYEQREEETSFKRWMTPSAKQIC